MIKRLIWRLACMLYGHYWFPEDYIYVGAARHRIVFSYKCGCCEKISEYER